MVDLPPNAIEHSAQLCASVSVCRFDPCDTPIEMRPEIGRCPPILPAGAVFHAIMQDGLELVVGFARHVDVLTNHQAGNPLTCRTVHDARFACIQRKALIANDGFHQALERLKFSDEAVIPGKCQIVGIVGEIGAEPVREAGKAHIEMPR